MRAVVLNQYGGPEVLTLSDIPKPQPESHEVLVRVVATAVNRADLLQRMGKYPPPDPQPEFEIPGLECSGVVEEVGSDVNGWRVGDRVMALLPGGGYAEYVTVPASMLMAVPSNLSLLEAAAIPEVFLTAYDALFHLGELEKGERVLIHAGGSGVGSAAIQLANLYDAYTITTVGDVIKAHKAAELGADLVICYRDQDFASVIRETGQGVDVVLDFIGAPYLQKNIDVCNKRAVIVQIGLLGGASANINLASLVFKRIKVIGTSLRGRPLEEKVALNQKFIRLALPYFATGQLRPVVDRLFSWEEVAEAHRYMASNANFGKIILQVSSI